MADVPYDPNVHGAPGVDEPYDPKKHGAPKGDQSSGGNAFGHWLGTRANKALSGIVGIPRAQSDINRSVGEWAAKQFNMSEEDKKKFGEYAARFLPSLNPTGGQFMGADAASAEQIQKGVEKATGLKEVNASDKLGVLGHLVDAGTEGLVGGLVTPAGGVNAAVRGIVPSVTGGILGEAVGQATDRYLKGTPFEPFGRLLGSVAGSAAGGAGVGAARATGTGIANSFNWRDTKNIVNDIWQKAITRDKTTMDEMAAKQAAAPPGTPLALASGGDSIMGVVRGSYLPQGEGRSHIGDAIRRFREGEEGRVNPELDKISTQVPLTQRNAELKEQRSDSAGPIYQAAGIPDNPQTILTQKPGPDVPSTIIGPDGKPLMKPGPPVTETTTNAKTITGKDSSGNDTGLTTFMEDSAHMKKAVASVKQESAFAKQPDNSMAVLDKAYHRLSDQYAAAMEAKNPELARSIRKEQATLAEIIGKENPVYGRALEAYADPSKLMQAGQLGYDMISNATSKGALSTEMFGKTFAELSQDQKREFLGGVATFLREKTKKSDRGTMASDVWSSEAIRERLATLPPTGLDDAGLPGPFGSNLRAQMDPTLEAEKLANRKADQLVGGSQTSRNQQDVKGRDVDVGGVAHDMVKHGLLSTIIDRGLGLVGTSMDKIATGRNEQVNLGLARRAMETDPAAIAQTTKDVAAAREKARQLERDRLAGWARGITGGILGSQ